MQYCKEGMVPDPMETHMKAITAVAAVLAAGLSGAAAAQKNGPYISGSLGFAQQGDSDNSGAFDSAFTTGDGVAVPPGTVLDAGTSLGWTTEFDGALFASAAYGWRLNQFRLEGELSYSKNDVDTHVGVEAGGGALGAADAAVLITGAEPLGITVADLVADGQGDITNIAFAFNGFYDFRFPDSPVSLYVGAGAGFADVAVVYEPSATSIIDADETEFFYQFMVGGGYALTERTELFGGYRYRATDDISAESTLLPATLDIENTQNVFELGVRFSF